MFYVSCFMKLVIVESPTKSKTISKFLSSEYKVESSFGHIRDLPKSKLGIDLENNFEPQYIIPVKARKRVNQLKKDAAKADLVILATDEDREGEAIAWHLINALGLQTAGYKTQKDNKEAVDRSPSAVVQRIAFHEITESAIKEALKNPRQINTNLVDAQQARRILDRLVGYKLSPFLWEKVMKRLSAGRVQSVALRLIAEREEEIKKFTPQEYWSIIVSLSKIKNGAQRHPEHSEGSRNFEAKLYKINNETLGQFDIKTKEGADKIAGELEQSSFKVLKVESKETRKNPPTPFTTSSLQQEGVRKLRYSAKQTMRFAQSLYEHGFITYMRTDSLSLSQESVAAAKNWIEKNLGKQYAEQAPRFFKTKSKLAQEAHEAIRPTNPNLTPGEFKSENSQEKKLYELIWRRFIASQLPQAIFASTSVDIEAKSRETKREPSQVYALRANGSVLKFDGFLKIWPTQYEQKELPELEENESLLLKEVFPNQHFTEPPPRYDEASLIKILEEYGIGRPSTYAPIISVIQERNYVVKNEQRRFEPTEVGVAVNKILSEHFPQIVDIQFTAKMEDEFDEIANGNEKWQKVIAEFYDPFIKNLEKKYEEVEKLPPMEQKTDEVCEKCGKPMIIKYGRFGKFLACSGFPECKNAKPLINKISDENGVDIKCPKCSEGNVVKKKTRRGRFFYGCSRYPACDYASWAKPEK